MLHSDIKKHLLALDKALADGTPVAEVRQMLAATVATLDASKRQDKLPAASQLGHLGGTATAKRGPEYFRELAARRRTHGGGRPRKETA